MRFKDFITEATKKRFAKDCAPFLEELKTTGFNVHSPMHLAFHGDKAGPDDFAIITTRENRPPTDSPKRLHDEVNTFFEKKFKWRARSEGVFVSGEFATARTYGPVYVVFPIGQFKYLWSPDIFDLTSTFHDAKSKIKHMSAFAHPGAVVEKAQIDATVEIVKESDWVYNQRLAEGLRSYNEMVLYSKKFYTFAFAGDTYNDVIEPFLLDYFKA